jgi:hypothetical protein
MLAEWSAECAADDPVLVVPWSDPNSPAHFVDLRENPYDLDHLPEAEQNPPLMQALRALNAARSAVFTAKCDAWPLSAVELAVLRYDLDLLPEEAPHGFVSYIDLLFRDRSLFASFPQQQQLLTRLTRRAAALDHDHAALDCVLRPALTDLPGPLAGFKEGFSISLYIKAAGPDHDTAYQRWADALEAVVTLLRSKHLALA